MENPQGLDVRTLLNAQTGRLTWTELQRHFARGVVLRVGPGLDLVETAARLVEDDRPRVGQWLADGRLARASTEDARRWQREDGELWAVVSAPWVLVQEVDEQPGPESRG